MYRVNVQGTVLMLDGENLLDLLVQMRDEMRGVIVPFNGGYVIDSLTHNSVVVNVSRLPEGVLRHAA
jgi:hypothetical protein